MVKERRQTRRQPVEYSRYCLVTEMSDGGVRVNANGYTVPDEFSVRFSGDGPVKSYKVIWRIGWDVGAKKIDSLSTMAS
jgi:hypothetical protein